MYDSSAYRRTTAPRTNFNRNTGSVDTATPSFVKAHLDGHPLKEFTTPYIRAGIVTSTTSTLAPNLTNLGGSAVSEPNIAITDVQAVSSYSWVESETPVIIVPGSPNIWTSKNPRYVVQDSGMVFQDQNAARMGSNASPLSPLFASIETMYGSNSGVDTSHRGGFDYASLDVITDRNNLRKLLRWVSGPGTAANGRAAEAFRIDVQRVGKTCVFTRRDAQVREYITGFRGYGHEYEKASTKLAEGCEDATGHHRVVRMSFGGLSVLLRFEVDACVDSALATKQGEGDLLTAFSGLTVRSAAKAKVPTRSSIFGLSVRLQPSSALLSNGQVGKREIVPHSSLIELKTRASHRSLDWEETYPQLYLSQTSHLYLAQHQRGAFSSNVVKYKLESMESDAMAAPEVRRAREGLKKLRALLEEILDEVRKIDDESVHLSLVGEGQTLSLYKRKEWTGKRLSDEMIRVMKRV
ncbi:hypothetical protein CONPUDRAFT_169416 [Coniophora puteana RWD-64-598 SS2]|uniref:Geranylgeranyl pyrophosphate synthetase n=1 Tax=Coniophora puteana (strain RWD-64-598) TaxID=741705 RepID=A0A5M3M9V3_CONPW|nr:uncharacterized protein CONPUDRAFT_169416 [Coniophora puteana RWD-64-598 SS2]EIW75634.1 hypothetical protein CONPUDRAFT_169416 [Coniophora puteana RWD-64-598 SS2]